MSAIRQAPLAEQERNALSRLVGTLRTILTRELRRNLEGTYGLRHGQHPEPESRLSLQPDQVRTRYELLGLWQALGSRTDLLVREAAFTHTNRLIAIRVAEALGLLPESLAQGRRSQGFRQLLEVAPLLGSDDDAGYWTYLQLCGDELSHDIPRLFDPRNPLLALRPSPAAVDELVSLVNGKSFGDESSAGSAWTAPDTLGWTYQFFNTDQERSQMRQDHAQPADSRELAVRNQFFTPDYVVRFLVHNTLGRRLVEMGLKELVDHLDLLVDPPDAADGRLDLDQVRVLDPACGSGHFLLGAYDVLELAFKLSGVDPADSAPAIVAALWGIDIDARAAQVAAAAITFRARRHCPDRRLPAPNVICARPVPGGAAGREALLGSLNPSRRDFLAEVVDQLEQAPVLGALLRVEESLGGETARNLAYGGGRTRARGRKGPAPVSLLDEALESGKLEMETLVEEILSAAQAAADRVTSTPAERVLAADGSDALRLITALNQRYDAVLMNPPFGDPVPETKPYLKAAYPWLPTKDYNLFALFVGRGLELCKPTGYLGAITSRAGMFLTTFQRWRQEVLLGNDLITLADLGHKVMHGALVEAAAYVVRPGTARHNQPATFIRLLRESQNRRPEALRQVCRRLRNGQADERVFRVPPNFFDAVPGKPMAYWMSPQIRRLFTEFPPLEGNGAEVRQGLATGDDFRFVRAFWEVDPARIARSREQTFENKRWVPFAKGGEYSPFWADIHLVVEYERDGERLRKFPGARPQNLWYFFRPGLTWPRRTQAGFNPSVLPAGCAFADKGPGIFATDPEETTGLLGVLCSRPTLLVLGLMTTFGSFEVGAVSRIPHWLGIAPENLATSTEAIVAHKRGAGRLDETGRHFLRPIATGAPKALEREMSLVARAVELIEQWNATDRRVTEALSFDRAAIIILDEEVGRIPAETQMAKAKQPLPPTPRFIDEELEIEAIRTGRSVRQLVDSADADWVQARSRVKAFPADLVSYLVGCAFGRWDVRIGRDAATAPPISEDPFAPVPVCPPGMLVGPDGLPARQAPEGYPLALTEHRVMVDEAGHPADLVAAMEAAAGLLVEDPRGLLHELTEALEVDELRSYLRKKFFKQHLSRYSKSRRKAPIYWPLTIPSRSWTVWVYAPFLSREVLYAVAGHGERRYVAAQNEALRLESAHLQASTPGAAGYSLAQARALGALLDAGRRTAEEVRLLNSLLRRIADCGWVPDLDDGIVICAAPFAEALLDWPNDPADARRQLKAGKFSWSSAHSWREKF
ncbi:MAG: BREX-1 system adenine-specific DNA-methyltransferase PglX [Actinomycetota bacterium]